MDLTIFKYGLSEVASRHSSIPQGFFASCYYIGFFWKYNNKKKRHKHLLMGFEFCSCYRGLIDRFHMPDVLYVAFRGNKKIINNNVYLNPINFASVLKMVLLFVRKDGKIIDISKNKLG